MNVLLQTRIGNATKLTDYRPTALLTTLRKSFGISYHKGLSYINTTKFNILPQLSKTNPPFNVVSKS